MSKGPPNMDCGLVTTLYFRTGKTGLSSVETLRKSRGRRVPQPVPLVSGRSIEVREDGRGR